MKSREKSQEELRPGLNRSGPSGGDADWPGGSSRCAAASRGAFGWRSRTGECSQKHGVDKRSRLRREELRKTHLKAAPEPSICSCQPRRDREWRGLHIPIRMRRKHAPSLFRSSPCLDAVFLRWVWNHLVFSFFTEEPDAFSTSPCGKAVWARIKESTGPIQARTEQNQLIHELNSWFNIACAAQSVSVFFFFFLECH